MKRVAITPSTISLNRSAIMGFAAILIYLAHVYLYVDLGAPWSQLFCLGNLGVDIFFLVSGVGLYCSLGKSTTPLSSWYLKRLIRVGVPFLLISVPYYLVYDFILNNLGFVRFALDISTLSYWLYHGSAWFVAALVPLYLLTPPWAALVEREGGSRTMICIVTIVVLEVLACITLRAGDAVLYNIGNVLQRLPSFVCGWFLGKYSAERVEWSPSLLGLAASIVLAVVCWRIASKLGVCLNFLVVTPGLLLVARFVRGPWLSGLGAASLESYLFNVYLLALFRDAFGWSGAPAYACVTLVVVAASLLSSKLNRRIVKELQAAIWAPRSGCADGDRT